MDSVDYYQLLGTTDTSDVSDCDPLEYNGSLVLHPCGLIANTLFNDIIKLTSGPSMSESGIAWESDIDEKVNLLATVGIMHGDAEACRPHRCPLARSYRGITLR